LKIPSSTTLNNDSNKEKGGIKVLLSGDFCPHKRIEELCLNGNYEKIYNDLLSTLRDKDISITNLECPLSEKEDPIKKTGPNLVASPKCIEGLKYGGFDVVTLANNHILDQGERGLRDTLRVCKEADILTVGAGENLEEASQPLYINVKEKRVAILNFAEHEFSIAEKNKPGANPLDPVRNYYQIKEAKKNADILLLIIHGGHEHYSLPSPRMIETYRFFADLGATAIIGHHTHCAGGYEKYNGVPIFYSLGNFIFDWENIKSDSWHEGYLINLSIVMNKVIKFDLIPYFQCKDEPGLRLMDETETVAFLRNIEQYCNIIQDSNLLDSQWRSFCESQKIDYLGRLLSLNAIQRRMLKKNILPELFLKKKHHATLLNLFRCESHRDVMIESLRCRKYEK